MKIVFATACLEPGCDGVGDYCRLLARQCTSLGHECALLSLADNPLERPERVSSSHDSGRLRLSPVLPWEVRIERARRFLDRFDPDWISLQFVSYGYHRNGMVAGLDHWLSELSAERQLHVMFHELWIGHSQRASLKEMLVGKLQQFYILKMLRRLNPASISTSIQLYSDLLRESGYQSEVLPLFGNIAIAPKSDSEWIFQELRRNRIDCNQYNRLGYWLFGFFGSLHPGWPPEPLLARIREAAARENRKAVLVSVGRIGPGKGLWKHLSGHSSPDLSFVDLGEQDSQRISEFLQEIDFGIAASPVSVIGKSGTATAMAEHGVPVIVNWDDDPSVANEVGWHRLRDNFDLSKLERRRPNHRLPEVAESFLTILEACSQPAGCTV
jgi:hypothetical protein